LLKVYKAYNPDIPWQSDIMIKSIEPYFFTKGILREEVYSRFIKPITEAYLGNVRLLTGPHVWYYCPNMCTTGVKAQHCPRP